MEIELIILTMSSKYKGYCVAGIDRQTGKWVRLVSDNEEADGALFRRDIKDVSGFYCRPLDIVRVRVKGKKPTKNQPENVLIDRTYRWLKTNRLSQKDFFKNYPTEEHQYIFGNTNRCLSSDEVQRLGYSLIMVKVNNLVTYSDDRDKTKATFRHNGIFYENISVTDPDYYVNRVTGKSAVIIMSIANKPYKDNKYYKFIAKIFVCE